MEVTYTQWIDKTNKDHLYRFDAHLNGKNIAYLTTSINKKQNYVWFKGLYVSPKYRKKGIATKLMRLSLKKYKNKEIRLRSRPYKDKPLNTKQIINFYKKFRFRIYDKQNRMIKKLTKIY